METLLLDIQRSSFNDGPGVRTTVFLKGCPLRCSWCHNPESQSYEKELSYNQSRCTTCKNCARTCQSDVHSFVGGTHEVDFSKCIKCGKCIETCPEVALQIFGYELSAHEVFNVIKKDLVFYKNTDGGMTLSGGEPLTHVDFSFELLSMCKEAGIHTCVETSGYVSPNALNRLLPVVDLFLFDIKVSDKDNAAEQFTGATAALILENLDLVCRNDSAVILRCPIIPGVNDNDEHFDYLIELSRKYASIKGIELLPYHRFGLPKSKNIGKEQRSFHEPDEEDHEIWLNYFATRGIGRVSIG